MARRSPTLDLGRVITAATAPLPTPGLDPGREAVTDAVLDATSRLLAVRGMRRWSIDDVADRAGLARATVYRHFGSRDALVAEALARDTRRFFTAIAESVRHVEGVEDRVVAGFVTGLRMARRSPLPPLLDEPGVSLQAVFTAGRRALVDLYGAATATALSGPARSGAEAAAEALVRLGLSYLQVPPAGVDLDDEAAATAWIGPVVRPLVQAAPPPRRPARRPAPPARTRS